MDNIPALRFPDFTVKYAAKKLGSLADVKTGNKDTQDRVNGGTYPFFVRSNTIERINSFSFNGEAVLTSGDGVGVGKNFHYLNGRFDFHQRVYCISGFSKNLDGKYFYHFFAEKFYRRVMRLSAKNSVDSVRISMIKDMEIPTPSLLEQQKIAGFLSSIDNKISLLTKKQSLLQRYKIGVMQKLFSQELRFKDEQGNDYPDWEEKKLGQLAPHISYGLTVRPEYVDDGIPLISAKEIKNGIINYKNAPRISQESFDKLSNKAKAKKGDIFLSKTGTIGRVAYVSMDTIIAITQNIAILRMSNEKNSHRYVVQFLRTYQFQKSAMKKVNQSTIMDLQLQDIKKLNIFLPSFKEQQKIANFLSEIDIKIDSVSQQIEQTQSFKKGLLQQMFV